jgi:peptidoglycan hydrolase-like protein with peptidoglycan-binding domain
MNRRLLVTALFLLAAWSSARADQTISAVQQKLKDDGFYYGEITGQKDAETTAALRRYQIRNGLHITGEIDSETQRSLGIASKPGPTPPQPSNTPPPDRPRSPDESRGPKQTTPPPEPPQDPYDAEEAPPNEPGVPPQSPQGNANPFWGTPFGTAPPDVQREVIIRAQMNLMRQGLYREGIDGIYGPGMSFALRTYQARIGLEPTGRLDVETLASLNLLRPPRHQRRLNPFYPRTYPPRPRFGPGGEPIYIPR